MVRLEKQVPFPLVSFLRKTVESRAFLRENPDIRRIVVARGAANHHAKPQAPLSPAEIKSWHDDGVLILRGFFDRSIVEDYKRHIDDLWQTRERPDNPLVIYSSRGGHYFRDAIDEDRSQIYRLLDLYLLDAPTRDLAGNLRLANILRQLLGYDPVVCNSILFEWGSEQDMHSDMFYMPPNSENQMLATWVAIDDVTEDNGPVLYVPGSHKLPPHRFSHGQHQAVTEEVPDAVAAMQRQLTDLGLRTEKFLAKRGDVLIWNRQLLHGGDTIRDMSARRTSLVTHYFSTCDAKAGRWRCAERMDGALLLMKDHVHLA